MKLTSPALLIVLCGYGSADALPAPDDVETRLATPQDILEASRARGIGGPYMAMRVIRESFHVPISFEWSFVNADRSAIEDRDMRFSVKAEETLEETLNRFCAEMGGRLQWGRIRGVICVWPAANAESVESTLDTTVTLELSGMSTWQAILEVCRQANSSEEDRVLVPRAEPSQDRYAPPDALRDHNSITLSLSEVTAREAICAVLAASPLHLEFNYGNYYRPDLANPRPPSSNLSITAFSDSRKVLYDVVESLSDAESRRWHDEARETIPPEKADVIRPRTQPNE